MRSRMLEAVGISETEEAVYRGLIRLGRGTSAPRLAEFLGIGLTITRRALASLEAKGLVSRSPGKSPRFTASPPDIAIQLLASHRQEELERAKLFAATLAQEYRQADPGSPAELVEIISGRDAVYESFRQLQLSAQDEVLACDRPPYAVSLFDQPVTDEVTVENPVEVEQLALGIKHRALYDRTALEIPGRLPLIQHAIACGEEARVLDGVPMKLAVADDSQALLPLSLTTEGPISFAILVRAPALIKALRTLFETLWRQGVPLPEAVPESEDKGDSLDRQILVFLAAGFKDEAIARQLGMGTRTVQRRIAFLIDKLGARTRFQAGSQAALRGLIPRT